MMSKDSAQDQELLDRYRRASDADVGAPSEAVRTAILAEGRRMAAQLAANTAKTAPTSFDVSRPAANDKRWRITAFGTAGAALLAALLIAPRYWESPPSVQAMRVAAPAPPKSANVDAANAPRATEFAAAPRSAPTPVAGAPAAPVAAPLRESEFRASRSMRADQLPMERPAAKAAGLQSAAESGDVTRATLLLDQGAPVDGRDSLGRTPLMSAVVQNRADIVRLLLARGADPNVADSAGRTPLQQAKKQDLQKIARILEGAGAH
jgi:Meckel syndrome type 1 protein